MPANIPGPVFGPGNQGRQPLLDALLLTLASQGPEMLMKFLERRQAGQAAEAADAAAQAGLTAFAQNADAGERAAISAAGGSPGIAATPAAMSPRGIAMPSVAPTQAANMPNMAAMKRGVAGPLLAQLQEQRTQKRAQAASDAEIARSKAGTAQLEQQTRQEATLFPLRERGLQAELDSRQAATRASNAATARDEYEVNFARSTETARKRLMTAQALEMEGRAATAELERKAAQRDLNMAATRQAEETLARIAATTENLARTFPDLIDDSPDAVRAMAAYQITGIPNAKISRKDLIEYYTQQGASESAIDLEGPIRARFLASTGLAEDDIAALDALLAQEGGDFERAIATLAARGATSEQLAKQANYYMALAGRPIAIPEPVKAGVGSIMRYELQRFIKGVGSAAAQSAGTVSPAGAGAGQLMMDMITGQGNWAPGAQQGVPANEAMMRSLGTLQLPDWPGWAEVTPEQRRQMDSGLITGWAPPARK